MKFSFTLHDIFLISPLITIFLFSLVPITKKALNRNQEPSSFYSVGLPILGLLIALALGGVIFFQEVVSSKEGLYVFSKALVMDLSAIVSLFLIGGVSIYTLLVSSESVFLRESKVRFSEWVFLLLNSVLGMLLFAWSNEFLMAFIGLELFSFSLYIMILLNAEKTLSKEAAVKYFILGSLASAIFAYGISFLYGTTGTTYLDEMVEKVPVLMKISRLFFMGLSLSFIGLLFKVAAFPFHWWVPDVYQGSASPLTGFMATAVKVAAFTFLLKFVSLGFLGTENSLSFENLFMWIAVLTMLVGNGAALFQNQIKRMLAYSAIAHSGYLLMALFAGGLGGFSLAQPAILFYLLGYTFATIGLFSLLNMLENQERVHINFDDLKGLAYREPYMAIGITILTLSLAGLPLTAGFFGKFFLFQATLESQLYWLSLWAILNSVLSVYYYLKPSVMMYMKNERAPLLRAAPMTRAMIFMSVLMVVLLGLLVNPFYNFVFQTAG